MRKNGRKISYLILAGALLLSTVGCGNKNDDKVVDYGGESSETESSVDASPGDGTGTAALVASSKTLHEQFGDYVRWEDPFTAKNTTFMTNKSCKMPDKDYLNAYEVRQISVSAENEQAFADGFFDDGATSLMELSYVDETKYMIQMYKYQDILYLLKINLPYSELESEEEYEFPEKDFSIITADSDVHYKWIDEENYAIHMYEGHYNGMNYGLIIGYDYANKQKYVCFEPADIKEYYPDQNYKSLMLECAYNDSGEKLDSENQCTMAESEVLEEASLFVQDRLGLSEFDSQMGFDSTFYDNVLADICQHVDYGGVSPVGISVMSFSDGEYFSTMDESLSVQGLRSVTRIAEQTDFVSQYETENDTGTSWETFFELAISNETYREEVNVTRDGYAVYLEAPYMSDMGVSDDTLYSTESACNGGCVMYTSKGFFGADMMIKYETQNVIENVELADFETVKAGCISSMEELVDEGYLSYLGDPSSFSLQSIEFIYGIKEADENGISQIIPAWTFSFTCDGGGIIAVISGVDGSVMDSYSYSYGK